MIHIEFSFPGGRYHATPWGHHVNEGLIEWPPSPWRLIRAFIATAFTKLDVPDPVPAEHPLRRLVNALANELPNFRASQSPATHSRHYMPLGDKAAKTTLVLDACAVPGNSPLLVSWPVEMDAECIELLHRIVESLGYLGRAESWVVGRVLTELPEKDSSMFDMLPHKQGASRGPGWEQVPLFAPVSESEYSESLENTRLAIEADFPAPPEKKKLPAKIAKQRDKAIEPYPVDLFACLTSETTFLQKHGWSQPPGSRRVLYWRPTRALSVTPAGRTRILSQTAPVEAILLALSSDTSQREVLPQFYRALPQAELLHRALVSKMDGLSGEVFTGKDSNRQPLSGHCHAHYIPLNLDRAEPNHLDHFLLWAPMGFNKQAQQAVLKTSYTWTKGSEKPLFVTVAGMGNLRDFQTLTASSVLGPSCIWESRTPFVAPRYVKRNGKNTLINQIKAELTSRNFPDATIEIIPRDKAMSRGMHRFVRVRRNSTKAPPQNHFIAIRLTFSTPVNGPLCLGYASHFGLGLFVPVED
jgi:CRISPR-associated protein Csb2